MTNPHDQIAIFYNTLFSFPQHFDECLVKSLDRIFREKHVQRVLDCGCGTGNPSIGLVQKGYDVLAIDTSPVMLEVAGANARSVGVKLTTQILGMEQIDQLEKPFDCMVFHDCLYHFQSQDLLFQFFRKVRNTLPCGGLVYIATKKWNPNMHQEARERFEFRGIIESEGVRLVVFDIVEDHSLSVFLLTEENTNITSCQRIAFPWFPYDPDVVIEALKLAGFTSARCINLNEEMVYNCVGILANA